MLFNSWTFFAFFIVVLGVYSSLSHSWQNRFLLAASLTFYGFWDWRFVFLMVLTSGIDYVAGLKIAATSNQDKRKRWLILSIGCNLAILGFFKYFNFFIDSAIATARAFGVNIPDWHFHVILPVGISFYTFQSIAYTVDIYRNQLKPAQSFQTFLLFVSYFPHLVAGPINRPQGLLGQVENPRQMNWSQWQQGALLIFIGLFKKIFVADQLAPIVDSLFTKPSLYSSLALLIGAYAFAFQIYCDFSGYTDMARGLAKIMGFDLMRNFNQPYFSSNITEFWRRWHISLSSWLRDYLYIPLGGSRKGRRKTYINLFLTMLLGGLWHGANWTFVIWGALHGLFLSLHKLMLESSVKKPDANLQVVTLLAKASKIFCTFNLVCLAWIFFRSETVDHALNYINRLLEFTLIQSSAGTSMLNKVNYLPLAFGILILILLLDLPQRISNDHTILLKWPLLIRGAIVALLFLCLISIRSTANVPFIYFQF